VSTLLHAIVYVFLHSLLSVLLQIANKMGLQKNRYCSFHEPLLRSRDSDWLRAGRPRGRSSFPGKSKNFHFISSRPALGYTQPPIQWVPGVSECGAVGGLSTRRNPVPVPLCPPQIPHDLTWAGTLAALGSR
jgi:hypothetical protein